MISLLFLSVEIADPVYFVVFPEWYQVIVILFMLDVKFFKMAELCR